MDSGQVGVFEQRNEVSFSSFLKSHDSRGLETEVGLQRGKSTWVRKNTIGWMNLEILSNFTDKTLEGELPDEQLSRLLVTSNFTKSDGSRTEPVRLLHTTSGGLRGKSMSGCVKSGNVGATSPTTTRRAASDEEKTHSGSLPGSLCCELLTRSLS